MGGPTRFGLESNENSSAKKRVTTLETDSCSTFYTRLAVAGVQSASLSPVPDKEVVTFAVKLCY